MRNHGSVATSPRRIRDVVSPRETTNLADLLERVLDKGIVIAGDVTLFLGGVQLLTLKIRLLVASIDKAQEIGINWWQFDPALSSRASAHAKQLEQSEQDRNLLKERLDRLERRLLAPPQEADRQHSEAGRQSNAASGYVLDQEGRMIAELKQLARQLPEDERPQAQKTARQPVQQAQEEEQPQAPQPGAAQTEQPTDAGLLVGQTMQERIAQAMRPVLEELRQRNAQVPQSVAQAGPAGQRGEEQLQEEDQPHVLEPEAERNAASGYVLDQEGRMIAELKQLAQQPPWEEPEAEQTEQSEGGGQLLGLALQQRIALAIRPVLGVAQLAVQLGIAEAPQRMAQGRPEGQQRAVQPQEDEQNAAPSAVLDPQGRMIAELKPLHEHERPQTQER